MSSMLMEARSALVKRYRADGGSRLWPDGIDSPSDRWYRPEDWTDQGGFIGVNNSSAVNINGGGVNETGVKPERDDYRGEGGVIDTKAYMRALMRWRRSEGKA